MSKARTLADFISDGSEFADGTISVAEVSGAAPLASPTFTGNVDLGDNVQIRLGNDNDLRLYHDNATGNSYIWEQGTGGELWVLGTDIRFANTNFSSNYARFVDGGEVELYYGNQVKLETATDGVDIAGNINLADNGKAVFGDGGDLEIYHNQYNSYVSDNGTGSLNVTTNGAQIALYDTANSQQMVKAVTAGAVELYYDGALKQTTTTSGVDITGEVKADKFTNDEALPDIRPALLFDFANSKSLDPRIEFYRETSATYWDGRSTTKAEENLLSYSQELERTSHWSRFETTVTANATTAPDGTTTAEALIETTSNNYHNLAESIDYSGSASFYVKANGRTKGNFRFLSGTPNSSNSILFDLSAVTVNVQSSGTSATITGVGNSWYRIGITGISNADRFIVEIRDNSNQSVYAGDGSSGFYIWGFQVESRDSVTAYTPTTSTPITKFQPTLQTVTSSTPRFDHDPVTGKSKGLLIEESRTNLESSSVGGVSYVGQGTQRTNAAVAPDGTITALECIPNTTNTTHVFDQYGNPVLGNMTFSLFAKANGYHNCQIEYKATGVSRWSRFNLSTGTVTLNSNATGGIEDVGNGWYRISISFDCTGTNADIERFQILDDNENSTFAGDGFSGMFIWGYQFEQGAFPTSYIPTSGATKTRSADVAKIATANILSTVEGTIYAESISGPTGWDTTNQYNIFQYGDDNANGYGVFKESGSKDFWFHLRKDNASIFNVSNGTDWTSNLTSKVVIGFDNSTQAYYVDGSQIGGTQTYNMGQLRHANITELNIGSSGSGAYFNGHIKKLSAYNERLTNATMQAMTE